MLRIALESPSVGPMSMFHQPSGFLSFQFFLAERYWESPFLDLNCLAAGRCAESSLNCFDLREQ